jgi:group I intron endonuclease
MMYNFAMQVYKLTNMINGKYYVGQTRVGLPLRMRRHKQDSLASPPKMVISKAIRKYGWDNFSVDLLETCETQDRLNEAEAKWIAHFDATGSNGYNSLSGGRSPVWNEASRRRLSASVMGVPKSPETRARMREAAQQRGPCSDAQRAKLRAASSGRKASDETKKKQSDALKGIARSPETRRKISLSKTREPLDAETIELIRRLYVGGLGINALASDFECRTRLISPLVADLKDKRVIFRFVSE